MKTSPSPGGKPPREDATPAAGETRTPAPPAEERPHDPARAAPAPDGLNLLVKEGWLKPGIDLDIDDRNALYDRFDEDEDQPGEYRP